MKIPFFLFIFLLCVSPVHARIYAQKDVTFINKVACPTPARAEQEICVEKIKQPDGFVIEREYPCPW